MALNIDANVEEGIWLTYMNDIKLKLRPTTPKFLIDERKRFVTHKKDWKTQEITEIITPEKEQEWTNFINDHMVEDWKGIVAQNNIEVPCTIENKIKLFEKFADLKVWVMENSRDLAEQIAVVKVQEEKN